MTLLLQIIIVFGSILLAIIFVNLGARYIFLLDKVFDNLLGKFDKNYHKYATKEKDNTWNEELPQNRACRLNSWPVRGGKRVRG